MSINLKPENKSKTNYGYQQEQGCLTNFLMLNIFYSATTSSLLM